MLLPLLLSCALVQAQAIPAAQAPDTAAAGTNPAKDAAAQKRVDEKLEQHQDLKKVDADVSAGVATLTGEVAAPTQKAKAAQVAKSVDGVEDVHNRVQLDPDIGVRFNAALTEAQAKIVRLIANLPLLVVAFLIVLASVWLGRSLARRMRVLRTISRHNPYMEGLVRNIVQGLVMLGGVLVSLDLLGATSLVGAVLGSAGVVGLVLGFAFKEIAENYVSGVLLSIRQPFAPGDHVRIDEREGKIVALNSRVTVLMTLDGVHLQMPNSMVFKSVLTNFTHNPHRRFSFTTNVRSGQSWADAMDIGVTALRSMPATLDEPAPSAWLSELSDTAATVQYNAWIDQRQHDLSKVRSEAMRGVRRALRDAGVLPPDGVLHVVIDRAATPEPDHREAVTPRDTSVDTQMERQLDVARRHEDTGNLLTEAHAQAQD